MTKKLIPCSLTLTSWLLRYCNFSDALFGNLNIVPQSRYTPMEIAASIGLRRVFRDIIKNLLIYETRSANKWRPRRFRFFARPSERSEMIPSSSLPFSVWRHSRFLSFCFFLFFFRFPSFFVFHFFSEGWKVSRWYEYIDPKEKAKLLKY